MNAWPRSEREAWMGASETARAVRTISSPLSFLLSGTESHRSRLTHFDNTISPPQLQSPSASSLTARFGQRSSRNCLSRCKSEWCDFRRVDHMMWSASHDGVRVQQTKQTKGRALWPRIERSASKGDEDCGAGSETETAREVYGFCTSTHQRKNFKTAAKERLSFEPRAKTKNETHLSNVSH